MATSGIYKTNITPSVIIVGGGVAGLGAAVRLIDAGYDKVKILEAEDRLGGRVHTIPFGDTVVDLGAHWVHGEVGNPVYSLGQELSLLEHSGDFVNVQFVLSNGSLFPKEIGMMLFEQSGNLLEDKDIAQDLKGSVQDLLIARCREAARGVVQDPVLLDAYLDWLISFECTIEGCDSLKDASAAGLVHYKQCPGDLVISWKEGGYASLIDILLRRHPKCRGRPVDMNEKVVLNAEVESVDWQGLGVMVKTTDGSVYTCDHAIVTLSLGVLKEKHKSMFRPSLPTQKIRTIMGLGIGTVNKIYIKFPHRWWPQDSSGFSLLWLDKNAPLRKNEYSWERGLVGFYTENRLQNTLAAWLVGNDARNMETYSKEQVKEGVMRVLKKFLNNIYTVPEPEAVERSTWFSNSHFRGSYSFRSMSTEALQSTADILAEPIANSFDKQVVFFAGEATHPSYYSTVHGALLSGWREADRLMELYREAKEFEEKKKKETEEKAAIEEEQASSGSGHHKKYWFFKSSL